MRVICKSGLTGWQKRLRKVYTGFNEFNAFDNIYGIAKRLGFNSAVQAWAVNPMVQGSVEPSDLRVVRV